MHHTQIVFMLWSNITDMYYNVYHLFNLCSTAPPTRKILDRRRLEEAHLKLCVVDVFDRYRNYFQVWEVHTNLQTTLDNITPIFYEAFSTKYAGKIVNVKHDIM